MGLTNDLQIKEESPTEGIQEDAAGATVDVNANNGVTSEATGIKHLYKPNSPSAKQNNKSRELLNLIYSALDGGQSQLFNHEMLSTGESGQPANCCNFGLLGPLLGTSFIFQVQLLDKGGHLMINILLVHQV